MIGNGGGFGVSFLPNGDQQYRRPEDKYAAGGRAPVQEPVSILQMRVPRVVGANPLAPLALLTSGGAGSLQPGQLEQLMRTLGLGPQMQTGEVPTTAGPGGPSVGGAPSPFASMQSLMPAGGAAPLTSVTAGMTDPGAGTIPTPPAPRPGAPSIQVEDNGQMPGGGGQDDSAALWELARRQREQMGRISY